MWFDLVFTIQTIELNEWMNESLTIEIIDAEAKLNHVCSKCSQLV